MCSYIISSMFRFCCSWWFVAQLRFKLFSRFRTEMQNIHQGFIYRRYTAPFQTILQVQDGDAEYSPGIHLSQVYSSVPNYSPGSGRRCRISTRDSAIAGIQTLVMSKELSFCDKLKFANPFTFTTWSCMI